MGLHESNGESVAFSREVTSGISILMLSCFFLSGLTGLIYQILWTRMIVKVIGSAPFAVSIILTVFMGGLGLGSFVASRMIDRVKEPQKLLRLYALLELAIGGYAIVVPGLLIGFKPLYTVLYNNLFNYFLLYNFLTLIGCVIILIAPVICMGATLPVLCRFYIARLGHLGTRAGRLYALNTIGAAGGSLLCGFWLINFWGVWGALIFAVLLNILIGLACLLASYNSKKWLVDKDHSGQDTRDKSPVQGITDKELPSCSSNSVRWALIIFAVSGFCAMAYEVIWTRLLGLIIGPTTYSFTIVLTAFIIGLALGSLIFGWLADRIKNPLWLLIFTQICAAFLALGISQLLGNSQFFFAKLIYHFKGQFVQLALIKAITLFLLMLGPTLCLGATFPLVGKIYTRSLAGVGRSIGVAYAINTLGAVLGSFCAGFLLIPLLGKEQSLLLVIGIQLLTSLIAGGYLLWEKRVEPVRWVTLGATALLGLILCSNFPSWNRQALSIGRYHRFEDFGSELKSSGWLKALWLGPKILEKYQSNYELMYYGDGIGGFTTVVKIIDALGTTQYLLLNSGKGDASSRGDMPTQTLSAHLPLLFHPDPKEVMVLGLASGITAGEVLHYPIERLDIIEISAQVISASNFFTPWNNNVLSHPKTELIIQDGRAHLELTDRKYDVIISEPSNPWMAGLASLFTREFFLLASDRLNEDGIFVQFLHSYQMDWSTFALIGRTFSQVFPQSLLVTTFPEKPEELGSGKDYLLIGMKGSGRLVPGIAEKNLPYARQSKNITLSNPGALYRLIVSEDLRKLCGSGPVHSDNRPHLEFAAPKQMYTDDPGIETNIRSRRWLSRETRTILRETAHVENQISFATFALSVYQPFQDMVDLSNATPEQRDRFFKIMEEYCTRSLIEDYSIFADQDLKERCLSAQIEAIKNSIYLVPDKAVAYNFLGNACTEKGELQSAIDYYKKSLEINPVSADVHNSLGSIYCRKGVVDDAISEYEKALSINPDHAGVHNNLGITYMKKGMLDNAIAKFTRACAIKPVFAEAHYNLGIAYAGTGKIDEAISEYKEALVINPDYADAHNNLGVIYIMKDMLDEAIVEIERTLTIDPDYVTAYTNLGNAYLKKGELDKAITEYSKTIALKPEDASAHNNMALAYYSKKDYHTAIIYCDKAAALGYEVPLNFLRALNPYR
jgi:spermidine synthase